MTVHRAVVRGNQAGMRLDLFLAQYVFQPMPGALHRRSFSSDRWNPESGQSWNTGENLTGLSRSALQKMISAGSVTVNGQRSKASAKLKLNDRIEIQWLPVSDAGLEPQALFFSILYEDGDLIAINKPPGMVVHPAAGNPRGTLVNALLYHCPDLPGIGGVRRPGIVHRLDKDTSGVMVVAKSEAAFRETARQFKERLVTKEYVAFVWGHQL